MAFWSALRLHSSRVVYGVVFDTHGEPVANTIVELHGVNEDCERLAPLPPSWWLLCNYLGQRRVRTDRSGSFAFGDVAPGSYSLLLSSPMIGELPVADVDVVEGVEPPQLRIEL